MKEDAREFFSSFQRNSLNSTRKTHASLLNTLREAMREMYYILLEGHIFERMTQVASTRAIAYYNTERYHR